MRRWWLVGLVAAACGGEAEETAKMRLGEDPAGIRSVPELGRKLPPVGTELVSLPAVQIPGNHRLYASHEAAPGDRIAESGTVLLASPQGDAFLWHDGAVLHWHHVADGEDVALGAAALEGMAPRFLPSGRVL